MSEGKIEKANKGATAIKGILGGILSIAIGVGVIVLLINMFSNNSNNDGRMSISEAQKKCTVFSFVGFKKADYEPATLEEASKHCLAMWDAPEREDTFIDYVTKEWETWKNQEYEGQTVEEFYNEVKDSI